MAKEIERKYLLKNDLWKDHILKSEHYVQAYLSNNKQCSIRIRISGDKADLNIKSMTIGIMRDEYEYSIPIEDARKMVDTLCHKPCIEKTRYFVEHTGKTWEIDVFEKENQGLVVAEVELNNADEEIQLPEWVGLEVTEEPKYYNVCLLQHPYSEWENKD